MFNGSVTVVNMGYEMYNDALYFIEEARKSAGSKFSIWRNCRAALYFMCQSAESDMTKLIVHSLKQKDASELSKDQRDLLEHLTNVDRAEDGSNKLISNIHKKYKYLCTLNGVENPSLPTDYEEVTRLRNKITHYSFSKKQKCTFRRCLKKQSSLF